MTNDAEYIQNPKGQIAKGNILHVFDRPETVPPAGPYGLQQGTIMSLGGQTYGMPKGQISTTLSASFNDGPGREVLVPTVVNGKFLTNAEAWKRYQDTGQHLGIFDTPANADAYAMALHNEQWRIGQKMKLIQALLAARR